MKLANMFIFLLLISPFSQNEELVITHQGEDILTIHPADILMDATLQPFIDHAKVYEIMVRVEKLVKEEPVNAKIGESGEIVAEKTGYQLDKQAFSKNMYHSLYSQNGHEIEVPMNTVHPKVDSEVLASLRAQKIGHYDTYFNSNNKERTHNIRLAAESIDSTVVFPGETFSFNEVVGKRTKEKGYLPAPVIVRGEVSEGIGGGICQVSSTIFNAVDNAGVQIEQRYSHSKRVPYVPEGRDATVSWYGPDFTFKNIYNQPLLLRANVYGGQMSVSVYSSDVINFESREIPGASKKLPEETELKQRKVE
ncbi:Putative peptidoglycan binding domain-containing protein [Halobacillus alkaliphilus]|uniref:Putative peptidoglycan binding domain-containing protein n=1 Tax=Halobacillus alkaliphilus TaxID=396056 RepID=A0A1I2QM86_9BACI|nr:VanW family protein [Halobacillus alkaliphilus]SFG28429.1 Putative peptidoglycan binding domain-containing protein [Halobacillus alkaliphilus]